MRQVESGGNPNAVSPKGAQGPFQLMPATASSVGVANPFNPQQAQAGATTLLNQLHQRFGNNTQAIIAAYNAGQPRVAQALAQSAGVPSMIPGVTTLPQAMAMRGGAGQFRTLSAPEVQAAGFPQGSIIQQAPNGQLHILQKGVDFQGGVSRLPGDSSLSGDDYLASVPENVRTMAQAIATNRQPIPTGTALKNPLVQQAVLAAQHANPQLNAGSYASALKTREAFTSGKQSQIVNRMNTALGHL